MEIYIMHKLFEVFSDISLDLIEFSDLFMLHLQIIIKKFISKLITTIFILLQIIY